MKKSMLLLVVILLSLTVVAQKPQAPAHAISTNVYPIQEGYVDAKGVLIYYKTIGQGTPLMIVHGGPGASHDYLLPYLLPLARGNKLVFIDERGSGRSEKLEDATQYTVENMVEDVESVRQALHLGKISLMGHSYGGVLAQAYAFKYQQNLTHLILGGTFYSTSEMNKVLAEEKRSMPPEALAKLEALEKPASSIKARTGKKAATRTNMPSWPGAMATFLFFISGVPIRITILHRATRRHRGTCIARCGARTESL